MGVLSGGQGDQEAMREEVLVETDEARAAVITNPIGVTVIVMDVEGKTSPVAEVVAVVRNTNPITSEADGLED